MHRLRATAQRLLLLTVSLAASLWAADLAFVWYEQRYLIPRLPVKGEASPVDLAGLNYNSDVVEREEAPGTFRILSFGDSFAYSIMQPRLSYAGVLERLLNEDPGDRRFRVVNLGEPATTTPHYLAAYRFWSEVLQHDAALFHVYLGNDLLDVAYQYAPREWEANRVFIGMDRSIVDGRSRRVPHRYPLRMLDYAYALWLVGESAPVVEAPSPDHNTAARSNLPVEKWRQTLFIQMDNFDPALLGRLEPGYVEIVKLFELAGRLHANGVHVAVALGPNEAQVRPAVLEETLEAHGATRDRYDLDLSRCIIEAIAREVAPDVRVIDLTPALRAQHARTGAPLYYRRNTHWDREGNELVAEVIAEAMRSAWLGEGAARAPRSPCDGDFESVVHAVLDARRADSR